MGKFYCGLGILFSMLLMSQSASAAYYGAIAYSVTTKASAYSYDYRTRGAAEASALERCSKDAADCIVVTWFRNACGALAVGPSSYGFAWGGGRRSAERAALNNCNASGANCEIKTWVCTTR